MSVSRFRAPTSFGSTGENVTSSGFRPNSNLSRYAIELLSLPPLHGTTQSHAPVFDRYGDIRPIGLGEEGLYHRGTRFLSGLGLRIAGERPLLLGSTARGDNSRLAIDLTNPDVMLGDRMLRTSTVHVSRTKVLWAAACHERPRHKARR